MRLEGGGFDLLYADPPWTYGDKSKNRGGAARHYKTASWAEIAYHIDYFAAAPNCVLECWHTGPLMNKQSQLLEATGWKYGGIEFDWTKTTKDGTRPRMGQGRAGSRATNEICCRYTRGSGLARQSASVPQAIWAPPGEHSEKPAGARERLKLLFDTSENPPTMIELYAREKHPGWSAWGDEI